MWGPRVPMYVISPWSTGGWVNSQVFDHTSVIRFLEHRFGVVEPNITPWRRAVCGDLTSAFDFTSPDLRPLIASLPDTAALAQRARQLAATAMPIAPAASSAPVQCGGTRPSRALPYELRGQDGRAVRRVREDQCPPACHGVAEPLIEEAPRHCLMWHMGAQKLPAYS